MATDDGDIASAGSAGARSVEDGAESIDDPALRPLRAVWLSMRDEEPPERGFAELMAAARVKAEEMAAPSLWERIVAMLRRPQVLALASIMVLVGGAIFISVRRDRLETASPAATQSAEKANNEGAAAGAAAPVTTPTVRPMAEPVGGVAEIAADTIDGKDTGAAFEAAKPEMKTSDRKRAESPARTAAITRAKVERNSTTATGSRGRPGGMAAPKEDASSMLPDTDSASSEGEALAQAQERAPTIIQLHKQARAAAARGDCEAARTVSKRIATQDTAYFKDKILTDPQLRSCNVAL